MNNTEIKIKLRPVVKWFAEQMELALQRNDYKGGWLGDVGILDKLNMEVDELEEVYYSSHHEYEEDVVDGVYTPNTRERIIFEAVDVANFAMMIADSHGLEIGSRRGDPSDRQPPPPPRERIIYEGEDPIK